MNVHPANEQATINLLQIFKWTLKSSQLVKTKDSRLERRGDEVWSVTETEEYVHLVFERDLDYPNLNKIRALEDEFFSIRLPDMPSYTGPVIVIVVGLFLLGAPIVGLAVLGVGGYWFYSVSLNKPKVAAERSRLIQRQAEILRQADSL